MLETSASPQTDAEQRLRWQLAARSVKKALWEAAPTRVAGIWTEHSPSWRVVAWYTGDEVGIETAAAIRDAAKIPVEIRTGARLSLEQLLVAQRDAADSLGDVVVSSYSDMRDGSVMITVSPESEEAQRPSEVEEVLRGRYGADFRVQAGPETELAIDTMGGRRFRWNSTPVCTTGFSVYNYQGATGLLTAGHCPDTLTYEGGYGTTFVAAFNDGYRDMQWSSVVGTEVPYFDSGTGVRPVTGQHIPRLYQVGDYVCHKGLTTGYSCGIVQTHTFQPSQCFDNQGNQVTCGQSWMLVQDALSGHLDCWAGDSGGPFFTGSTAYGILTHYTAGYGAPCTYMAIDYLWDMPPFAGAVQLMIAWQ